MPPIPLPLDNPFLLAPLAGYTDLAFRLLCRAYGAGLCYSEMISCHGLVYRQAGTLELLRTTAADRPVSMQLFGSDPAMMGEAAAFLSGLAIDAIDINMGCPVKKVVKKGAGAALMKDIQRAEAVLRAVCRQAAVPVTVKIRTGWNHQRIIAPEFARMAEACGAAAVAVHGRTWSDGFSGPVDWQTIARVREAVAIPVIGNGDISCRQDGLAMMKETGCHAVMIGRAALGAPWVFSATAPPSPSRWYRIAALNRHLELIDQHHPEHSLARIKNQAGKYFRGLARGSQVRKEIYGCQSLAELQGLLRRLAGDDPACLDRPQPL